MAQIGITVDDRNLAARLQQMANSAKGMKPALQNIGRKVQSRVHIGFDQSRGPRGQMWPPLKTRIGQPLRNTGDLRSSIQVNVGDNHVDIGTNLKTPSGALLGRVHQFGVVIKPKKGKYLRFPIPSAGGRIAFAKQVTIPARPFMPVNQAGQIDLPEAWQTDVLTALRRHLDRTQPQA